MRHNLFTVIVSVPEGSLLDDADKLELEIAAILMNHQIIRPEGKVLRGTPGHGGQYMTFINKPDRAE